jgi:5'(3')-deoxyribonucleotidase
MADKGAVGAHVYIDDSPYNIVRLRDHSCNTIIFSNSTNLKLDGPRANNWQEAERLVMETFKEWQTGTRNMFG